MGTGRFSMGNTRSIGVRSIALAIAAGSHSFAGETILSMYGAPGDRFGASVASIGDVDGDGRGDLLVGAPEANGELGHMHVVSGASGTNLLTVVGTSPSRFLGFVVSNAGDIDADGAVDYVVSAMFPALVRVYSGATGAVLLAKSGGPGTHDLGEQVAGVGDFDGDGHDDVAMAAPNEPNQWGYNGSVEIFSGATGGSILKVMSEGFGSKDAFGTSIVGLPDVSGDGVPDLAVGAPQYVYKSPQGYVRILSGASGGVLHHVPNNGLRLFGESMALIPDADGDALADLIVSAPATGYVYPDNHGHGAAAVLSSASGAHLHTFSGSAPNQSFGSAVASATDYAADGETRVAISSLPLTGTSFCRVLSLDGTVADEYFGTSSTWFGSAIANLGDTDGDGTSELAFGAQADSAAGTDAGSVVIVSCDGFKQAYGSGCGGASVPTLALVGCPAPDATLTVKVRQGPALAGGVIVFGLSSASIPVSASCNLLVSLPLLPLQIPFNLNGAGEIDFGATLPASTPSFSIAMQAWITDPTTPLGFSASNGFRFGF